MFTAIKKNFSRYAGVALLALALQACNKEFDKVPQPAAPANGNTLGQVLNTDPSFSILKAAVERAGLTSLFATNNRYTVFAPDNDAFAASGLSLAVVNALPAAQLQSILSYHVIPQALPSAQVPTTFPNVQMPTLLSLPGGNPLLKMSIFPSRRGNMVYVNNIPVKQADVQVGNTVVHKVAALVAPPTRLLADTIARDADLSYFRAAVARADEGQVGLARFDSLMKFGVANMTVLAPNNAAFQGLLTALLPAGTPISEAIFAALPVATVRGIIAYHLLARVVNGAPSPYRAYSVNFPATPTFLTTFVNASVPSHPGVQVQATFTGPLVTRLTFTGVGNGGVAANVVAADRPAVNGVFHKIDRVLLPQ